MSSFIGLISLAVPLFCAIRWGWRAALISSFCWGLVGFLISYGPFDDSLVNSFGIAVVVFLAPWLACGAVGLLIRSAIPRSPIRIRVTDELHLRGIDVLGVGAGAVFAAALSVGLAAAFLHHARTTPDVGPTSATLEEAFNTLFGAGLGLFAGSAVGSILVRRGSRLLAGAFAGLLAYGLVLVPVWVSVGPNDESHGETAGFLLFLLVPLGVFVVAGAIVGSLAGPLLRRRRAAKDATCTSDQLIDHFRRVTGDSLILKNRFQGYEGIGDFDSLGVSENLVGKYGTFTIGVHADIARARRDGLLGNLRPDENGIFWEYHPAENEGEEAYWSASKLYRNIQLTWWTEARSTDERWQRLDRVLTALR